MLLIKKSSEEELSIILQTAIIFMMGAGSYYYLNSLNFKTTSFYVHLFSLGSVMSGFFYLGLMLFGSIVTGGGNLFFLKKYALFIPVLLILFFAYFFLVFAYPFFVPLLTFSFLGKVGLYVSSFFLATFVLTLFLQDKMKS